jgi:hypothetical protein
MVTLRQARLAMMPVFLFSLVAGGGILLLGLLREATDGAPAETAGGAAGLHLLSGRARACFLLGFGAVGAAVHLLAPEHPALSIVASLAGGIVAGAVAAAVLRHLRGAGLRERRRTGRAERTAGE